MTFAAKPMLWLLAMLALPLIGFFWWAWRERQRLIIQFISARLLTQLQVGVSASRQKARMALIVVAVVFLALALARPQWGVTQEEARQRGLDIIVAIDTSNSMLAEDVSPNRLTRAKLAALDLARKARTDRLGLVAFAGTAFLECPLTLDDAAFSQSVDSLDTRTISQGGTALAEAIQEALRAFKKETDNHRVLVLFTDGEDHDSEAVAAAEKAAKEGMIIFTIGIGSADGELLRIKDERGRIDYIRDESGNPVKSRLNEDLLQQIAHAAKGFYLPLRGTKTMDTLYDSGIAPLPKSTNSAKLFQRFHERFYWPLSVAMILLLVEMFLPDASRRRSRRPVPATAEAALPRTAALVFLLLLPMPSQAGGSATALREYHDGKYDDALKDYDRLLERKQDDPRLHFNAGAAAYQSRKLDEAVKQFGESLNSPDLLLQQRSYYNLGNTLYRLGQQIQDSEKKQAAWENSLKQYDSALKLNQQDEDAKFNQDFVKRQIEELKKQQSQSQSNNDKNQKKDQNKQDQNKQDQQKQDQDKQDQKKQDQGKDSQNQKGQDQKDQAQNQQKSDQEKKDAEQQEAKNQKDQQDQSQKKNDADQKQASGQPKDKSEEEAKQEAAMMAAGQMTPRQAEQLLDSLKGEEQVLRLAPTNRPASINRPFKNW